MKGLKARYRKWKDWCSYSVSGSKIHQIAVFLGVIHDHVFERWTV